MSDTRLVWLKQKIQIGTEGVEVEGYELVQITYPEASKIAPYTLDEFRSLIKKEPVMTDRNGRIVLIPNEHLHVIGEE